MVNFIGECISQVLSRIYECCSTRYQLMRRKQYLATDNIDVNSILFNIEITFKDENIFVVLCKIKSLVNSEKS